MSKLELWYPVKPYHLNQPFGGNAEYYSKFHDQFGNPLLGHNGNDLMAVHGQPVYADHDGLAYYTKDIHGGQGVIIHTTEPFEYDKGSCWFNIIHWHMIGDTDPLFPPPIPLGEIRTSVKVGDLIGYADNTGAPFESSGDHCHLGLCPVDINEKPVYPGNGFNGCIDALPYENGYHAVDSGTVLGIYQQILNLLKNFLPK